MIPFYHQAMRPCVETMHRRMAKDMATTVLKYGKPFPGNTDRVNREFMQRIAEEARQCSL